MLGAQATAGASTARAPDRNGSVLGDAKDPTKDSSSYFSRPAPAKVSAHVPCSSHN